MIANDELRDGIVDMLVSLQQAAAELFRKAEAGDAAGFRNLCRDMKEGLERVRAAAVGLRAENPEIKLNDGCECALSSLLRIERCVWYNEEEAKNRIEFELLPMLAVTHLQFLYWGCAYPDEERERKLQEEFLAGHCFNPYIEEAEATGNYQYDLSVYVTAYNKLEYTKLCVESLLRYMPEHISWELILINNGSSDGTSEYFASLHPTKQLDVAVNCAVGGIVDWIVEGKYALNVSNDVILTPHAVENMLKCMEDEENVGWVVPSTSNVSNLQSLSTSYQNNEEMVAFAEQNNRYDRRRHERRSRLCNPIVMYRTSVREQMLKEMYLSLLCKNYVCAFPDDRQSLWLRRKGYQLILAKDAYCHHFGSVTIKDEITEENKEEIYRKGIREFIQEFGVDPWGDGFCYHPELFRLLACDERGPVNVLGINCGLGGNPLKVRESIKENTGNLDVEICNYTDRPAYLEDLAGLSNSAGMFGDAFLLWKLIEQIHFHYIIVEGKFLHGEDISLWADGALERMRPGARLCVRIEDGKEQKKFTERFRKKKPASDKEWTVIRK